VEQKINLQGLRAGDEKAFRAIVEEFQDRVFNTCFGFLGTREEAEDAAQETFIAVFSSVKDFREEARLSTWIYRIAVTSSLQAIRRKRRKKRFTLFFSSDGENDVLASVGDCSENTHPLAQLENKELAGILYKAMNRLPESQRVAFTLHKIEGLPYKEIGDVMNLSLSSVESLIHRAKQNLQKHLGEYYRKHG
jgi:RNA polymerase sigma-70 factor (ECF subfamily)